MKEKEDLLNVRQDELVERLGEIFSEAEEIGMNIDQLVHRAREGRKEA